MLIGLLVKAVTVTSRPVDQLAVPFMAARFMNGQVLGSLEHHCRQSWFSLC